MKLLVTGASGMLGFQAVPELRRRGHLAVGADLRADARGTPPDLTLDITRRDDVLRAAEAVRPEVILHCAAWTQVDAAEDSPDEVRAVNAGGTRNLADAAEAVGARMIYISTEYVFDGSGSAPRRPDDRRFGPLNVYGRTKLEGEEIARARADSCIVRISWSFGPGGANFVRTMLGLGRRLPEVRVVDDQVGLPTYTPDLAQLLADMAEKGCRGTFHAAGGGEPVSRWAFCREIFRMAGLTAAVIPVSTADYGPTRARRPLNSRLDTSCLRAAGLEPLPPWEDALARYLRTPDCAAP